MGSETSIPLLIPAIASLFVLLAIMTVYGHLIRNETQLHDLRKRVKELHYARAMQLARVRGKIAADDDDEPGGVEIVGEIGEDHSESDLSSSTRAA